MMYPTIELGTESQKTRERISVLQPKEGNKLLVRMASKMCLALVSQLTWLEQFAWRFNVEGDYLSYHALVELSPFKRDQVQAKQIIGTSCQAGKQHLKLSLLRLLCPQNIGTFGRPCVAQEKMCTLAHSRQPISTRLYSFVPLQVNPPWGAFRN
jgi:hypothetical protein